MAIVAEPPGGSVRVTADGSTPGAAAYAGGAGWESRPDAAMAATVRTLTPHRWVAFRLCRCNIWHILSGSPRRPAGLPEAGCWVCLESKR
ncbi:hypothetical protein GCM10009661_01580 [Catellatospora chokoriensis]|uniref:Uncharacterized protein n=1 Tax=Catellatospora chokoriensis TaxID=310353 RepID=A0A8J3NW49_9ACTN|nr:hypothetical protein Cch02nite_82390 [Catellatospora chokoriensis]